MTAPTTTQPVCLIVTEDAENELVAGCSGVVLEVLAPDGLPVQVGQELFRVERANIGPDTR